MTNPRDTASDLIRDERSLAWPWVRRAIVGARRAHRDERGVVLILFIFLAILFALAVAVLWNTSRVVSAKMRAQVAADTAAYTAATWTSRALNLVAATNMLILRNASAHVSAVAINAVIQQVPQNWANAPPGTDFTSEIAPFNAFVASSGPTAAQAVASNRFLDRIAELHAFQRSIVEGIPDVVAQQRSIIEELHGVEIHLAVPGRDDEQVVAPVRRGDSVSFTRMLHERRLRSDAFRPAPFETFQTVGRALTIWNNAVAQAIQDLANTIGDQHYVLATQQGANELPLEDPSGESRRAPFTVFAAAVDRSLTGRATFLLPTFFPDPVNPLDAVVSCAQAETYNGHIEVLTERGVESTFPYPFRVWTVWGWGWQPRLTRCDLIEEVLATDSAIGLLFNQAGISEGHYQRIRFGLRH